MESTGSTEPPISPELVSLQTCLSPIHPLGPGDPAHPGLSVDDQSRPVVATSPPLAWRGGRLLMQVFTFIISIILKLPRHKKEVCIAHRGIDKNTYSRAVTHSWAFWDDQPVEGECEKDHDDGHGEQEREDESGKLNFF